MPLQQGRPQSSSSWLQNSTEPLGDSRFHPPFLMVHSLAQAMPLDTQASVWNDDTPRVGLDPQLWCLFFLPAKNLETVSPHPCPKVDRFPRHTSCLPSSSGPFPKPVLSTWEHGRARTAILGPDSLYPEQEKPGMGITTIPRNPRAAGVATAAKGPQVLAELHH